LGYARSKTEIEDLKKEILDDINQKRATKNGQESPKDNNNNNKDLAVLRRDAIHEIQSKRNEEPVITYEELDINNKG